jgi:branched-chain amino acid transport system substrate-binding protein
MPTTALKYFAILCLGFFPNVSGLAAPLGKKRIVKVGLVFDLTGKREPAIDVVKGIEVAAVVINESGDLQIELIKFNSGIDGAGTRAAVLQVLANPPDIIIAEVDSSKAAVAATMLEEAKRVMITPYATSPVVTQDRRFVFRACFSDDFQGAQLAKFAGVNLSAKRAVIFSDGSELYSQTLAAAFREQFKKNGGQIVYEEKILPSSLSFKPQLDAAVLAKTDVVFLPVYEQTAARFINEGVLRGAENLVFLGGDGWGASRTFKDIVFRKNALVSAYWVSHYSGDFTDNRLKMVAKRYKKQIGEELTASSAIGYDSLMVAGEAFRTAKNSSPSQEDIAEILRQMPAYKGVSGTIKYGGKQDPEKSLFIRKVDKDKMGFVVELKP